MMPPKAYVLSLSLVLVISTHAQPQDRPVFTEVFNNPSGTDGPVQRNVANPHQEYIEIYLPPASDLMLGLNADALNLTVYEIEGDSGNGDRGKVNQRIDLPTFDLDASNGMTPGAIARPSNGVVLLGWVDYALAMPNDTVPVDLANTVATRLGLINGGISTSPSGAVFIAINGAQFGGTTNFPVPLAESLVDINSEAVSGIMANGSNVYLLVDRDEAGYVELHDRRGLLPSDPDLPGGTVLQTSAMLDAFAGNDDSAFEVDNQPYVTPTGLEIDLEDILPSTGIFSLLVPQVPEGSGSGYARKFANQLKTTEDGIVGNERPALDALSYREIFRSGPFYPTPGSVVFLDSVPALGVSEPSRLDFDVIAGTTGQPALICANTGGNFEINIAAIPSPAADPNVAGFAPSEPALNVPGQTIALPTIAVTVNITTADHAATTSVVTFQATNSNVSDPAVVDASQVSTASVRVLNPATGMDEFGLPLQATTFAAVVGFGADASVANEFASSALAQHIAFSPCKNIADSYGQTQTLLNPNTDLEDIAIMDPLRQSFPFGELNYINAPGATQDLVSTVINSAKVNSGSTAYDSSIDGSETAVRAIAVPLPETATTGGFTPAEELHFFDESGQLPNSRDGLYRATTSRTFEIALFDTNTTFSGIEGGAGDDFGVVVEVGSVGAGATAAVGELIFLSVTGGLQGEDLDSVDVPGMNASAVVLIDLEPLASELGVQSIRGLFLIDSGATNGTLNPVEVWSLAATAAICLGDLDGDNNVDGDDSNLLLGCVAGPDINVAPGGCSPFAFNGSDLDNDNDADIADVALLAQAFTGS